MEMKIAKNPKMTNIQCKAFSQIEGVAPHMAPCALHSKK